MHTFNHFNIIGVIMLITGNSLNDGSQMCENQCLLPVHLIMGITLSDDGIFVLTRHSKFEPVHGICNNVVYASSKASDQPAHTRSLIRVFARRLSIV